MILVPDSTANSNKIAKENLRLTSEPLDVRHIACPPALWILIPVMKSALNGEVIQILTTDPHDKDDIRRWLKKIGGGTVNAIPEQGYERILVRKYKAE